MIETGHGGAEAPQHHVHRSAGDRDVVDVVALPHLVPVAVTPVDDGNLADTALTSARFLRANERETQNAT